MTSVSARICSSSDCFKFSMLNRCFMEEIPRKYAVLRGEPVNHRFNYLQAFLGFSLSKVQRRQKAKDLTASRYRQKSRGMQQIGKTNRLCPGAFARQVRNIRRQFESNY